MRLSRLPAWSLGVAVFLGGGFMGLSRMASTLGAQVATASQQPALPAPSPSPPASSSPQAAKRVAPEFFVMIDPSHGGDDKGAVFAGKAREKDFTLALARELRKELEERGVAARLLRDSDLNLSLERRAEIANEEHASI